MLIPSAASPVVADAWRELVNELASHLDDFTRDEDGALVVRWQNRKFLVIVAPEVE